MGSRRWVLGVFVASMALGAGAVSLAAHAADPPPFPDCSVPTSTPTVAVGQVTCQLVTSAALGGDVPVSYYVPPACDPALGRRCPTLYLMHGFGGSYHSMLGTAANPSAWVAALASGPVVDPETAADPWNYSDPAAWVAKPNLDFILVAPHGRTLPGGFGPAGDLDGYWTDWNPRYAAGGDTPRYATPAPRFDGFLHDELIPYVEAHLPAGSGRAWRALTGTSLGGFGSYRDALLHPDQWTSVGSVSGAFNFLFRPWIDPMAGAVPPVGVQPPLRLPGGVIRPPSASAFVPYDQMPGPVQTYIAATLAFGDPNADEAYFRGNTARDLAANARAFTAAGEQTLGLRAFVNDTVPRRPEDVQSGGYPTAQAFEDIVLPMNIDQDLAFRDVGAQWTFAIHPGLHGEPYRGVWYRAQLEAQYARVSHADGSGAPRAAPTTYDYRTISRAFSIWGWSFTVDREPIEFVNLTNVTCTSITLQGTGVVAFDVPATCGTGVGGVSHVVVDLGPSMPLDEPQGLGATAVYGRTVQIALTPVA
jgi:S-formylglutathione hydrolase FrmB